MGKKEGVGYFFCLFVLISAATFIGWFIGWRSSDIIEAIESNRMVFTSEGVIYREKSMRGAPWVFKQISSSLPYVIANQEFVEKNEFIAKRKDWRAFAVKIKYRLEDHISAIPEDRPRIEVRHFFRISNFFEIPPPK